MNLHTTILTCIDLLQLNLLSKKSKNQVSNLLLDKKIEPNMWVDKPPHFFETDKFTILEWYAGQLLVMATYPGELAEDIVYQFLDSFKEFEVKYFGVN